MRKKVQIIFLFIGISISIFGQNDLKIQQFPDRCNQGLGIIIINTNDQGAIFNWANGIDSKDSIAYNLSSGSYQCNVRFSNGNSQNVNINVSNISKCLDDISGINDFQFQSVGNGGIKFTQFNSDVEEVIWEMGDGTIYKNHREEFVHIYSNPGTYSVCMDISTTYAKGKFCKDVQVLNWDSNLIGFSLIQSEYVYTNEIKQVEVCGGKEYIFYGQNNETKLGVKEPQTGQIITLPIDDVGGEVFEKINTACFNNKLYFNGIVGSSGRELCETNGTISGTKIVFDYNSSSTTELDPYLFKVNGNNLYLAANPGNYAVKTSGLYRLNGSSIIQIPGINVSFIDFENNGNLLIGHIWGGDFFSTDGVSSNRFGCIDCVESLLGTLEGYTYFLSRDPSNNSNTGLWKTNGTENGTSMVKQINWGQAGEYLIIGNKLYFGIYQENNAGFQLWISNGSNNGTVKVKDLIAGSSNSNVREFNNINGELFFLAKDDSGFNFHIWKSNGTAEGTYRIFDTNEHSIFISGSYSKHKFFIPFDEDIIFKSEGYLKSYNILNGQVKKIFIKCSNDYFYPENLSWKYNEKLFFYNDNRIFELCKYSVPKLTNQVNHFLENITIEAPNNYSINFYNNQSTCTITKTANSHQFTAISDQNFIYNLINNNGCQTKMDILKHFIYDYKYINVKNYSRCSESQLLINLKASDYYSASTLFFIKFINSENNQFTSVQLNKSGKYFSCEIPVGFRTGSINFSISSNESNIVSQVVYLSPYKNNQSAYFLGSKKIESGQTAILSVLFTGLPPFSFNINGSSYQTNFFLSRIEFQPTQNTSFVIGSTTNACGLTNIPYQIVDFEIFNCNSVINHNGSILPNIYSSNKQIISSGFIQSSNSLEYNSEKNILLLPGFSIPLNATFKAEIKNCP